MRKLLEAWRHGFSLASVALILGLLGWIGPAIAQPAPEPQPGEAGVVVEEVGEGSALEAAGLQVGDVLLSWRRLPAPPANPEEAQGELVSPFDWEWLVIEQAPRGRVKLLGRRQGEEKVFEVAPGKWKGDVRPLMVGEMLEDYARGKKLVEAEKFEAGIDLWHKVAGVAENQAADERSSCWLLLRIGDAWGQARQWEKAYSTYRSALETTRDPLARVTIWKTIGDVYEKASEFERAREAYVSAQEILERTWGESLIFARGLNDLGDLGWRQGRLDAAQGYWQRALDIRQRLAPDSLDLAASLNNLAVVAIGRAELDRATEYNEGSLKIKQKLAPGSLNVAYSLYNLGNVAADRGDLDRAAEYYERSLEIFQKLAPGSLDLPAILTALGILASDRGDLDRAAEYYEGSLEIYQKLAPGSLGVARNLNNLGILARQRGDLVRATRYYEGASEIVQKLAPDSLAVASILGNQGVLARQRGDSDRGAEYLERSLEILQKLAPGSLDLAKSLHNLGNWASDRGDWVRAAKYYEGALEIRQKLTPGSSVEALTLHLLATLHRKQNQPQSALAFFLQALQALESQVSKLGGSRDVQAGFRAGRVAYYRDTIDLLLELKRPEQAFHILERSRARSFLDQLAERDLVFSDIPEELDRQRRRIAVLYDRTQQELAELSLSKDEEKIESLRGKLRQLQGERDAIEEQIRREYPNFAALQFPQPLDLQTTQQALDPGTVMLSYSIGEQTTDLFVVASSDPLQVLSLPVGEKKLTQFVDQLHNTTHLQGWTLRKASRVELSKHLYKTLIEPAAPMVQKSARILIIPDGPLRRLPFAALIRDGSPPGADEAADSGRDWHYLVEWKPLHSVLSATVYAELKKSRRPAAASDAAEPPILLTAFGDPLYPGDMSDARPRDVYVRAAAERGFDFPPLPYTRREIEGIAGNYPTEAIRTYLGAEATEERAKSLGRDTRILHFATHGKVDDRFPLNSFVALTIPEEYSEERDNGLLQAWEIFERVRLDADLVVLSACRSGLGKELGGDGLIGLTRAFQYAGARTVAATLWGVADQTTAELMIRFYRYLRAGKPKDVALQAAQIELISGPIQVRGEAGQTVEKDASAPYYWAAFQLFGDWQ